MATYEDSCDNAASAGTTTAPIIASAISNIRVPFSEDEINTAYQLYELLHESGPRYLGEIGTESAELVVFVVGQNPKPARAARSRAPSQPFHTHSIDHNAEKRQILRTWLTSTQAQLHHPDFLIWKKKNPNALSVFKLGLEKTRRRKPSTDTEGSTFSLVDVKDNFGKGKQQVQATSEGEDQEQVPSSSLHSTSHSTLCDHNNPQPTPSQQLKPFPLFIPCPYTEKPIPSTEKDEFNQETRPKGTVARARKGLIQPGEGATLHQIPHWTEIGLKAWYREMNRQVLKKKIHPKLMKSIIKLYDFEQCLPFPTAESTLRLEQIFGIDGVPWPNTHNKLNTIHLKASKELKSLLRSYGFVSFFFTSRNQKARLVISQQPGVPPPRLPQWLRIPFLVVAPGSRETITLETMNPIIQRGDKLAEQGRTEIGGTLGLVMKSKSAQFFGITAGHVIPTDTHVLDVHRSDGEVIIPLKVATFSVRRSLPGSNKAGELTSFLDDCGFPEIPLAHLRQFEVAIANINPHYYGEAEASEIGDPLSVPRRGDFDRLLRVGKIMVYKVGASTDLTVGHFIGIKDNPPPGMYGRAVDNHQECLWWDSVFDAISDSEDSGDSISCHVGGISKSDIGKESDNDSNGSNGSDDGEETSDSSGSNHKAHSPLKEDRENQDHNSGPDFEGSIHYEDGEEWYQKESEEGDDNESFEDKDSNEWLGVVKWISSDYEFAAGGDSGSLDGNATRTLCRRILRMATMRSTRWKVFGTASVFTKASEAGHLPEVCLSGAGSTWEPASAVRHLQKLISAFIRPADSNLSSH